MSKLLSISWGLCALCFLFITAGCINEQQTITGNVVDESGSALSNVSVTACYSDWGWSNGQLVWDKNFCSPPALTDNSGAYVIEFSGPDSLRLRANKDGWIQTSDFRSADPLIVLTSIEVHGARQAAEAMQREKQFRNRLPDESATDYYCRVILNRTRPVDLQYQGEKISITPSLLKIDTSKAMLFALYGSRQSASALTEELQLQMNRQTLDINFSFIQASTSCESNTFFIETTLPEAALAADQLLELRIPSIAAMFDVNTWNQNE